MNTCWVLDRCTLFGASREQRDARDASARRVCHGRYACRLWRTHPTPKAIAAELVVSPKTVRAHIEHIYRKIGSSTRAAASLFAMRHGLLPELEPTAAAAKAQQSS
jgi:DNA-binding CsgD family transcriptional regulator